MKRILALLLLSIATLAYAKEDPAEFTVNIHVTGSSSGSDCHARMSGPQGGGGETCKSTQTVKVTIDGKKYVLLAETIFSKGVLPVGDYKAKLLGKPNAKNPLKQKYELLLEDGSTRKFKIVGEEE